MTSMASTASVASMTSTASFHQRSWELDVFIKPSTQITYSGLSMWNGSLNIHYFIDFEKNLIFDYLFHKKGLVVVIWVIGMIKPSGSVIFSMKWGCRGHWGHWGCWGHWGHWGCRGFKAWKIITEDFRIIQAFKFNFNFTFWKKVFWA